MEFIVSEFYAVIESSLIVDMLLLFIFLCPVFAVFNFLCVVYIAYVYIVLIEGSMGSDVM